MGMISWKQDPEPLVTFGDAIASFLDRPDVTTERHCIAGRTWFEETDIGGFISLDGTRNICVGLELLAEKGGSSVTCCHYTISTSKTLAQ